MTHHSTPSRSHPGDLDGKYGVQASAKDFMATPFGPNPPPGDPTLSTLSQDRSSQSGSKRPVDRLSSDWSDGSTMKGSIGDRSHLSLSTGTTGHTDHRVLVTPVTGHQVLVTPVTGHTGQLSHRVHREHRPNRSNRVLRPHRVYRSFRFLREHRSHQSHRSESSRGSGYSVPGQI